MEDDAAEAEPGEGWGPGRVRVGAGGRVSLGSWSRPSRRAAGIPRSQAGVPGRAREPSSRRRRLSTTSCCPMPSAWTPSLTCSWPRSKATWAGPCSSKSCGPGASSGPENSPRKFDRACRMGLEQRLRGRVFGCGGPALCPLLVAGPSTLLVAGAGAVVPGSEQKVGKYSSLF